MSKCELINDVEKTSKETGIKVPASVKSFFHSIIQPQNLAQMNKMYAKVKSYVDDMGSQSLKQQAEWAIKGKVFKDLPTAEQDSLYKLMVKGDRENVKYTVEELKQQGMSDKQIEAYYVQNEISNDIFYKTTKVAIENSKSFDDTAGAKIEALDDFVNKANSSNSMAELSTKINAEHDTVKKGILDSNLSDVEKFKALEKANIHNNAQREFMKSYNFGYVDRTRGEGSHTITIKDSMGNVIHYQHMTQLEHLSKKDEIVAQAIKDAEANLARQKAQSGVDLQRQLDKRYEYMKNISDKLTPKAREFLGKMLDKNSNNIEVPMGSEKDFNIAKRAFNYANKHFEVETKLKNNEARSLLEPIVEGVKPNQYSGDASSASRLRNEFIATKENVIRKYTQDLRSQGKQPSEIRELVKAKQEELDAYFQPIEMELEKKQAEGTFRVHSLKRNKNYISGVPLNSPAERLAHQYATASNAIAKMRNSPLAYRALAKLREEGDGTLIEQAQVLYNDTFGKAPYGFAASVQKVSGIAYATQFAMNHIAALVDMAGYHPMASSIGIKLGLGAVESNKLSAIALARGAKIYGSFLLDNAGKMKLNSLSEFMQKYSTGDKELDGLLRTSIEEGANFDMVTKEYADLANMKSIQEKTVKGVTFSKIIAEKTTRMGSLIFAHSIVKKNPELVNQLAERGLINVTGDRIEDISKVAEYISNSINSQYGKANRPHALAGNNDLARTVVRSAFPFQSYMMNFTATYASYMADSVKALDSMMRSGRYSKEEQIAALSGAKAFLNMNAHLILIGGKHAAPILVAYDMIDDMYDKVSNDLPSGLPSKFDTYKSTLNDQSSFIDKVWGGGLPMALGIDITGSTDYSLPFVGGGSYWVSRYKQSDSVDRISKGEYGKAIRDNMLVPRGVKEALDAAYDLDLKTKGMKDKILDTGNGEGEPITRTTDEAIRKFLGFGDSWEVKNKKNQYQLGKEILSAFSKKSMAINESARYEGGELDPDAVDAYEKAAELVHERFGVSVPPLSDTSKNESRTVVFNPSQR